MNCKRGAQAQVLISLHPRTRMNPITFCPNRTLESCNAKFSRDVNRRRSTSKDTCQLPIASNRFETSRPLDLPILAFGEKLTPIPNLQDLFLNQALSLNQKPPFQISNSG